MYFGIFIANYTKNQKIKKKEEKPLQVKLLLVQECFCFKLYLILS